ncbi:MAG: hypothetical protein AAF483_01425 [Planctomycetota bacterium]
MKNPTYRTGHDAGQGGCKKNSKQAKARRKAALLVVVLVVLTLVGMMTMQAVQTLMLYRHHDVKRAKLLQAGEMIQLGRHALKDGSDAGPESTFEVTIAEQRASIELQSSEEQDGTRIVVRYPLKNAGPQSVDSEEKKQEITATWQSTGN